ncbi:MAG: DUF58 domain-containing protein [Gemmataceae bacterium]|nr:DUF58 domain-containing protein [Gemmataceae bacterium]MDW8265708.1 DUF58 domain-containing protein [Gemmataceae bacterium]
MRLDSFQRLLVRLATHDFAPRFSAKVRRMLYNPFGVLVLSGLAALLCGLFLHAQGFVLCGGVVIVTAAGVMWPWLALRGLSGTVAFERTRITEGESVEVRLTLRNRLPWSAWGLAVRGGGDQESETVAGIASAPRRRLMICRWTFTAARRGLYPVTPIRLATGFPFGLWECSRHLIVEAPLVVWPRTWPVGPIPPVSGAAQIEGNVSRSKVGSNGDVLGVRPYRRGDSPRRIHWGQTARHDRLIVCELQSNARPVIQLVLDVDASVHVGSGPDSSREWAIRMVASLARGWLEAGAQVGLTYAGRDVPPASGRGQITAILDALAAVPETCSEALERVLNCPRCRGVRDGLQIIVTTDRGAGLPTCSAGALERQRWIVLESSAFDPAAGTPKETSSVARWMTVDAIERIPSLLRAGWREARHGS